MRDYLHLPNLGKAAVLGGIVTLLALPRGYFLRMVKETAGMRESLEDEALARSLKTIARRGQRRRPTPRLDSALGKMLDALGGGDEEK